MARIVLIDDEIRLLQTFARFLEQQGHEVVRGERFADVQEQLWPGRFELLITDIVMPGVDGMQVLRQVVERQCQEPVLLITGQPNLDTAAAAVRQGAFDYLSKPVTKDKLLEAVGRALRHVQLLRERDSARRSELQVLQNLAQLGEQASVLSHELRTPITGLRQALVAVAEKLGVDDRVLIEELIRNIGRIERILSQTLSFARPLRLSRQECRWPEVIEDAVAQARRLPIMAGMRVTVRCSPELPPLQLDRQLMGEVLVNLLRNAAEACEGHGCVTVTAGGTAERSVLEVADDGPGVPRARRDEIFRPFNSSKQGGTGIGLAICRKIVQSHGGTLELADGPGPGACFRLELDRLPAPEPARGSHV